MKSILKDIAHRPWPAPKETWQYYQEWNNVVFIHFEVSFEDLRKWVPENLVLDSFEGKYYISIVAFTMEKVRPRYLPAFSPVSNFHEVNTHTYIDIEGKKGVYFLKIEAEKWLSAFLAKSLSGLPYEKSRIKRTNAKYHSSQNDFLLDLDFRTNEHLGNKSPLDIWLTERYCLYLPSSHGIKRFEIHHKEWPLQTIDFHKIKINYPDFNLTQNNIHSAHYSEGVQVFSWDADIV